METNNSTDIYDNDNLIRKQFTISPTAYKAVMDIARITSVSPSIVVETAIKAMDTSNPQYQSMLLETIRSRLELI